MPQVTDRITRCLGLVTQYNPLNTSPGALIRADNMVIDRENVMEDRRGYANYFTLAANCLQLMVYSNTIVTDSGTTLSYDNAGSPANYSGSYSALTSQKMRFVEGFTNLYVTTTKGVQVFTDLAGTAARNAGSPRSLDPSYALNSANVGFLTNGNQAAYRVVILRVDANNNYLYGYPSTRLWVTNASGSAKNVDFTLYLPAEVTTADVLQFYRTSQITGTSTDSAGDEMQLVYQYNPTNTDISNGYVTFTDSITDALRGATLYTSPSQGGIQSGNDRPPVCKDLALFRSTFMCYANTSTKQRQFFTMVGSANLGSAISGTTHSNTTIDGISATDILKVYVGQNISGSGIPVNTTISSINTGAGSMVISNAATAGATVTLNCITQYTITIAGTTYTFGATESASTGVVGVSLTGVAAVDIDLTARSLIRVINRYATNTTIYGYYDSGPNDTPGLMHFDERSIGGSTFTIQVSNAKIQSQFSSAGTLPPVSPSTTTQCTSTNQVQKNAIYIAQDGQLEAVPTLQYKLAGSASKEILRIAPLRDSLIIIKEDGVFRMTGNSVSNFDVAPLDLTVLCKSADSVAVLANQVFMLSNQGVVAISENGVQVVSREIEPNIRPLLGFTNIGTLATGCAYESDRAYLLSLPTVSSDTVQNQIYRYNIFTRTWTHWTFGFNAAIVEPKTDKLFFSKPASMVVYRERKNFLDSDYTDPETAITISAINLTTNTISFTLGGTLPVAGWAIVQSGTSLVISSITNIGTNFTATMLSPIPTSWTAAAATLFPFVGFDIEWDTWAGGPQGIGRLKQVSEAIAMVDNIPLNNTATQVTMTYRSNFDDTREFHPIAIAGGSGSSYGSASWGSSPWGSSGSDSYGFRDYVPRGKQYCHFLNVGVQHKAAGEKLALTGLALCYQDISEVVGR